MIKALCCCLLGVSTWVIAAEVWAGENTDDSLAQVTSVSQLSDVQPTDWAFVALQSLVERYGCIAGYPNSTFRGNRAMTRYEFAAGLHACLDRVNELIATATAQTASKADLAILQRLQEEFAAELETVRGRVDALEARTATLEAQQFSTTTKLSGEVIFAITDVFSGDSDPLNAGVTRNNAVFANRIRLNLLSSFTGKDELKIRLVTGSTPHPQRAGGFRYGADPILTNLGVFATTPEGGQTFNQGVPGDNFGSVELGTVSYKFPIGKKLHAAVFANRGEHVDYLPNVFSTVADEDGGSGSLSTFGQYSPIYRIGASGAGLGLTYEFSSAISLSAGYLATDANEPGNLTNANLFAGGLFNGRYSALAQLSIQPSRNIAFGLTYVNSYTGGTPIFLNDVGTTSANIPSFSSTGNLRLSTNSYGVAGLWRISTRFVVNGWFMYTNVQGQPEPGENGDSTDIYSYGITLAFPDLGKKGNLGGIIAGVPPHATRYGVSDPTFQAIFGDDDLVRTIPNRSTPVHLEAFYKYQVNDNISITPGVIWLIAPNQTSDNPDVVMGTIRTTFKF